MRSKFIRLIALAVLSVTALLGFAAPAFANEGEAAAESSVGTGLLFPGLGEWIPMLIGFILLWLVLAKFGW